jgi:hypothetical protein
MVISKIIISISVFSICTLYLISADPSPVINGDPSIKNLFLFFHYLFFMRSLFLDARCAANETVGHCPMCDKDCAHLFIFNSWADRVSQACPESCGTGEPVCLCKHGFFRNPDGACVMPKDCPRELFF